MQPMFEEIKQMLIDEIQIKEEDIKPEAELVNDLGLNSIEIADLVLLCEERYDIEVDEEETRGCVTLGDFVNYLEKTVNAK